MHESLYYWVRNHTEFLYTRLLDYNILYVDLWSIVHFWSGIVLFILISAFNTKWKWTWFISLIVFYEVVELLFIYLTIHIFKPEKLNDQFLDVIIGLLSGFLCNYYLTFKAYNNKKLTWLNALFSAGTLSFVWVGYYQYKYNYSILNTVGINAWAFILWLAGGYLFLQVYLNLKNKINLILKTIILSWTIYFLTLLIFEYAGYYILNIREISVPGSKALIFGLIHGTISLRIYYLLFPFFAILFYEVLCLFLSKAIVNIKK